MINLTQLGLFIAASLVLIFTPGPDIIYVMTRGMAQGRKAALAAAAGFSLGNFVCFGAVGLCSGWIGIWLRKNSRVEKNIGRVAGCILIALGLSLALPQN